MKAHKLSIVFLGLGLQILSSAAFSAPSFDSTSPACAIPIFNWSEAPVKDRASANKRMARKVIGGIEDTQNIWIPNGDSGGGNGDLVGRGMYFEADPFSSAGYGPILTIAYLKPNQPLKDVRSLGPLDSQDMLTVATPAIRSESPMILHTWIAMYGNNDGVTVRARKTAKPEELPFDYSKTEVVISEGTGEKLWSDHAAVKSNDTLGQALQKYTDRFSDLYIMWNNDQPKISDESLWKLILTDLGKDENLAVGEFSIDRSGASWMPFDDCDEMSADDIADAIQKLRSANLISQDAKTRSSCDLKNAMIAQFKRSLGYTNLVSIYTYIQKYKLQLGIHSEPDRESGVSSFSATCLPK